MEMSAELERLQRENQLLKDGLKQAERMQRLWLKALDELKQAKKQLKGQNQRLISLYQVASVLAQTTDQKELFNNIMDTMLQLLDLAEPAPMGIFLVGKDGSMQLAAHRPVNEAFDRAHEGMRVGDCLCGRAAQGEVIVCGSCNNDSCHTIPYTHAKPHGHLILPLKAKDQVVGVFYYYLPPNYEIDEAQLNAFAAISNQLGLAIENTRLYNEVLTLTTHDPLTGLGNRRFLQEALERGLCNVERHQGTLSLVILDIDNFKQYNDTYGHVEGDNLLAQIGNILMNMARSSDLPVRYGGEEFMMLFPQTSRKDAAIAAERIRAVVEQQSPVTISLGVATISMKRCPAESLIKAADEALYAAKQAGRNRVAISPWPEG